MNVSVIFSKFTMLCNHYLYLVSKHFHLCPPKPLLTKQLFLIPSPSPRYPPVAFCLCGLTYSGYIIEMKSYSRRPFVCGVSLSMCVRSIHLAGCISTSFFWQSNGSIVRPVHILFIHPLLRGTWVASTFAIVHSAAMKIVVQVFVLQKSTHFQLCLVYIQA